jgi:hypothetical protein
MPLHVLLGNEHQWPPRYVNFLYVGLTVRSLYSLAAWTLLAIGGVYIFTGYVQRKKGQSANMDTVILF